MLPPRSPRKYRPNPHLEILLVAGVLLIGAVMAWYVYAIGLTKALTDQSSHLNFARLSFDSMTPGVSQLGFWPPLLHILLMPFVAIPFLYQSGLAGAVVLLPCLALSTVILYRLVMRLTAHTTLALIAAVLFVINPFILYYATTPMMEVLFITNLFLVAYCMMLWLDTSRLAYLLAVGVFVSLACLSRFEGFLLVPITGLIVLVRLLRDRIAYREIEALLILFGLLAVVGLVIIFSYSMVYGHTPFAFAGGAWLRDPAASLRPARYSVLFTLRDAFVSSAYMLGTPLVFLSSLSFLLLLLFRRGRFETVVTLLILASPLFFVLFALFTGSITINVPELPPYIFFHNDRYALTWIGFTIVAPILFLSELDASLVARKWMRSLLQPIGVPLLLLLLSFNFFHLYDVAVANDFSVIREDINSPDPEQMQVADELRAHYTGGKILSARVDNDPVLAQAGVPLDDYIYEGNYLYFDQVMREPWFFAQWVLMHNPAGSPDGWVQQNEPVYKVWGESKEFLQYYDLVLSNAKRKLYKLNENHLLQLVKARGYNTESIPSLNPRIVTWQPSTIYAEMLAPAPARLAPATLTQAPATVREDLMEFYWDRLKPDFEKGYFLDSQSKGSTESQSYALLQAMDVDDTETFDRVWAWTKRHLQRSDGLFSWKFTGTSGGAAVIDDANSATDADTDIAYALLQAGTRWQRPQYVQDALPIIQGIWDKETALTGTGRHLTAGNWAAASGTLVLNPSYFSPAAYRLFTQYDTKHDWDAVIKTGYEDLQATSLLMQQSGKPFLPPDWAQIDLSSGAYQPFSGKETASLDYSFDAFRVFWRIAFDYQQSRDVRAKQYLQQVTAFDHEWETNSRLCSLYVYSSPDDRCHLDMGTMAGAVSKWTITEPARANQMLQTFSLASGTVKLPSTSSFYEKSWYWFMLWQWSNAQ